MTARDKERIGCLMLLIFNTLGLQANVNKGGTFHVFAFFVGIISTLIFLIWAYYWLLFAKDDKKEDA